MKPILPNIYVFNPTCEYAIANKSETWQPNRILSQMEFDLSVLPLFFSKADDYILVDEIPSVEFKESLKCLGIEIPNFVLKSNIKDPRFVNLPKNKILPWGWSPVMHKYLSPLKSSCSEDFKESPVFNWKPEYRNLYSRKFALDILNQLVKNTNVEFFIPIANIPRICRTQNEVEVLIEKWGNVILKAPWSSSGRGHQPITKTPVHPKVWEKIMSTIKAQDYIMVEPYLKKVFDFAFEFELIKGKVIFLGISNFSTDKKGQYLGNDLNGLPDSINPNLKDFITLAIDKILYPLSKEIEKSELAKLYEGVFGIDALIYLDEKNELKINPCLEINLRYNMGFLSLRLEKLISPDKKGIFRTYFQPGTTFHSFKKEMGKKHPVIINGNKIESGFFPLVDSNEKTLFGAYLLV